jgi:sulfide dehydrogenase cytochrome subunit
MKRLWIIIATFMLLNCNLLSASELTRLVRLCDKCHGKGGYSEKPEIPIIAGFSREGFHTTMDSFRKFRRTALPIRLRNLPDKYLKMNDIALRLSQEDVNMLAEYYSGMSFRPALQKADLELASRGKIIHEHKCEKCHSDNGAHPVDDAPILAGQWTVYLRRQFMNILSGKRLVPKRMKRRVITLSSEDIEALLNFYALEGTRRIPR